MAITCDVCGGELLIGAGGKTAKCTVCGVSYSIERIREKARNTSQTKNEKYLIFWAKNMNWGSISLSEGTWRNTEYKVYSDGSVWSKADFSAVNSDSFWGKLSQPVEEQMDQEMFRQFKQILNREFENTKTVNACDGEGWEMISYEQDGSEWHKISGHIYGVSVLERIAEILKKGCEKKDFGKKENVFQESKKDRIKDVDYEIVDFEIVEDESVSREEDFVFVRYMNEELQEVQERMIEYVGKASTVIIPEKTDILGDADSNKPIFRYPECVKKVVLGNRISHVEDYAFSGCKNLEEVHIPDSVNYLWYSCGDQVYTEDGLELDGCCHIFKGCTGLKKVTFGKQAWQGEDICDELFKGCHSLKHVELPETIQWIGRYMFEDCTELEEIVIPDNIATIGQYAFKNCRKLKRVVLPNHPIAIHPTAFSGTMYIPPRQYTTGFNVNRCCVCGGKLNWSSSCKKCGRQIIYSGNKQDWK